MTLDQKIIQGNNASALLNNPLFKEAFKAVREDLTSKASTIKTTDKDACADIVRGIQVLEAVERCIVVYIEDGKIAQKELDMIAHKNKPRLFIR